jgi:hypothetical protein
MGASRAATSTNLHDNEWAIEKTPFDRNALETSPFRNPGTNPPEPA